jgi:WD40-like Beta Propeller Repeat
MRKSWKALGVVLLALGLEAGCNDYNTSIQYPTGASIVTLAPSGVVFGSTGFTLTVIGSSSNGFQATTVVEWNGQKLASTYVDAVTMTATVPANLVAKVGTAYVNTLTPQSGTGMNGLSNSIAFLIYGTPNPVPVVTSVTPNTAPACGSSCGNASVKITIAGSDFLSTSTNGASTVTFTGLSTKGVETAINVSGITSTQIQAVIPGAMLADADPSAVINVINPPSGVCLVGCPVLGGGPSLTPQTFTITGGAAAAAVAEETPALSQDGRYVAFSAQENETTQIMLRDTCLGVQNGCTASTKLISVAADNSPGNADSHTPVISADGRYIAFSSAATNLLEAAPAGRQVYLRDTCAGASAACKAVTSLVSTDPGGALNGTESIFPSISSSGRYIVFLAVTPSRDAAKGKLPAAAAASTNSGLRQVFLRDTCLGATSCTPKTTRISLSPGDTPANSNKPVGPALSGLAKQIALAERKSATVFTPTVPVDDEVFLAVPQDPKQ